MRKPEAVALQAALLSCLRGARTRARVSQTPDKYDTMQMTFTE
jgi:hypothetical protein